MLTLDSEVTVAVFVINVVFNRHKNREVSLVAIVENVPLNCNIFTVIIIYIIMKNKNNDV